MTGNGKPNTTTVVPTSNGPQSHSAAANGKSQSTNAAAAESQLASDLLVNEIRSDLAAQLDANLIEEGGV